MKIIVGVSGATGVVMSQYLLKALRCSGEIEVHLVVSEAAKVTWNLETDEPIDEMLKLADYVYDEKDMAALISSGSFLTDGMIVMPCSMKTLSAIAHGYADNLLVRAVDVCLKEGRKVVLVPREMPLGKVHVKNMLEAMENGCAIVPPMLTFYNGPKTIEDQINHVVGKVLMQFGIKDEKFVAWRG